MEKSIESIWKEGFIDNNLLTVPKIENIDSLKSIYFIDEFKGMYQKNIIVLAVTGVIVLFAFIMGGVPFIGIFMFLLFESLAFLGKRELDKLDRLNIGYNSYTFIKQFDNWLNNLLVLFSSIYKIWIPLLFIGFTLGLLQSHVFVPFIGDTLINKILNGTNSFNVNGLLIILISSIAIISILLSYFSKHIFQREMKSIYGNILGRLEQLLVEFKELDNQ